MTSLIANNELFSLDISERSYKAYIAQINNIPLLSKEQEISLFNRYKNNNDLSAVKELVLSHLRMVVPIASKYYGYGLDKKDLIQEGNIGLLKSIKSFDLKKNVRLATYAIFHIKNEINQFIIKNWSVIKVVSTVAQRTLFFNMKSLFSTNSDGKLLSASEISAKFNVSEKDVIFNAGENLEVEKSLWFWF